MDKRFEDHAKEQEQRLDVILQEIKSGGDGAHVAAGGESRDTPPENQLQRVQQPQLQPLRLQQPQHLPPPPVHPPLFQVQGPPSGEREPVPRHVPSEVGPPIVPPRESAGARGAYPAGELHSHIPWKLTPPVFSGDSSDYLSFRKEALIFAEYVGFGEVFTLLKEVPVADSSFSTQQMRNLGYIDDEIDLHRKAYQFLRSSLKSKVDLNILYRARSPAEAWLKLESWHNPRTIAATQSLNQRFQTYTMKPGQNPLFVLNTLEEMAAQLMQQNISISYDQVLIQFLSILPDSEYEVEKRTFSNGTHLDRDQVLLAIRTRYEILQRQRRKGGARRDSGHAFIADAGYEKFSGKHNYPSGARGRGRGKGREKGRDVVVERAKVRRMVRERTTPRSTHL